MALVTMSGSDLARGIAQALAEAGADIADRIEPSDVRTDHLCCVIDDLPPVHRCLSDAGVGTFVSPPSRRSVRGAAG